MRQCVLPFLLFLIIGWLLFVVLFFWVSTHSSMLPNLITLLSLGHKACQDTFNIDYGEEQSIFIDRLLNIRHGQKFITHITFSNIHYSCLR